MSSYVKQAWSSILLKVVGKIDGDITACVTKG